MEIENKTSSEDARLMNVVLPELMSTIDSLAPDRIRFQSIYKDPANYCHLYNTRSGLVYQPVLTAQFDDQAEGLASALFYGLSQFQNDLKSLRDHASTGKDKELAEKLRAEITLMIQSLKSNHRNEWEELIKIARKKVWIAQHPEKEEKGANFFQKMIRKNTEKKDALKPAIPVRPKFLFRQIEEVHVDEMNSVFLCNGQLGNLEEQIAAHYNVPTGYAFAGYPSLSEAEGFSRKKPQHIRLKEERAMGERWESFMFRVERKVRYELVQRGCKAGVEYKMIPQIGPFLVVEVVPALFAVSQSASKRKYVD